MSTQLLARNALRSLSTAPGSRFLPRHFSNSSAVMGKQEWMCILPDKAGALEARMKVRPQHLEAIKPHEQAGLFVLGGASLDEPLKEGQGPKINGSILMAVADSKEEVMELIKKDIYYTSGVWDLEKVSGEPTSSS
ncbi:hypothetical protein CB0940_11908 [Cercospora beticola]|uniref:YCII-related domain-containing protein n=1 Tax=Cercospora beticola TaxID=122368 RepID=A0A2G5IDH7_CERBT|nr:hypothetical protein CB0940_11908 [Cercospora beticola]PIB02800.1 hypothetical protein CB0940_11908 [Cercospora beticola]